MALIFTKARSGKRLGAVQGQLFNTAHGNLVKANQLTPKLLFPGTGSPLEELTEPLKKLLLAKPGNMSDDLFKAHLPSTESTSAKADLGDGIEKLRDLANSARVLSAPDRPPATIKIVTSDVEIKLHQTSRRKPDP